MKNQLSLIERFTRTANSFLLDQVGRFAQPRRVDENNRNAANVGSFFDCVARRARYRRNDCAIVSKKAIEQTRFTDVRFTNDRRANSTSENLTFWRGFKQVVDESERIAKAVEKFLASVRRYVFIWEINMGFDVSQNEHQT